MDWLGFGVLPAAGGGLEIEDVSDHGGSSGCACQTYVLVKLAGFGGVGGGGGGDSDEGVWGVAGGIGNWFWMDSRLRGNDPVSSTGQARGPGVMARAQQ